MARPEAPSVAFFDVFDTIVSHEPAFSRVIRRARCRAEHARERVATHAREADLGVLDFHAFSHNSGSALGVKQFGKLLVGGLEPIEQMHSVVESLVESAEWQQVNLLTNVSEHGLHQAVAANALPELELFAHIVESWRIGLRKPDPLIFRYAEAVADAAPGECLLVDDQLGNVLAAQEAGWAAHHFDIRRPGASALQLLAKTKQGYFPPITAVV